MHIKEKTGPELRDELALSDDGCPTAEIVQAPSKLLTTSEAARVAGVSASTIVRRRKELGAARGTDGVFRFDETVVRKTATTLLRRAHAEPSGPTAGELGATVFEALAEGKSPAEIVIELRIAPEVVDTLTEQWFRLWRHVPEASRQAALARLRDDLLQKRPSNVVVNGESIFEPPVRQTPRGKEIFIKDNWTCVVPDRSRWREDAWVSVPDGFVREVYIPNKGGLVLQRWSSNLDDWMTIQPA